MMQYRFFQSMWLLSAALLMSYVPAGLAADSDAGYRDHPGFVDGSALVELAGEDGTLIEVSIHGPLLKQVGRALAKSDDSVGSLLKQIESISAVVIENAADPQKAGSVLNKLSRKLDDDQWERLGRVREKNSEIWVYVLYDDDAEELQGLTVLINESNGGEVVFANLAGVIDLELIGELGGSMGIPGLRELGGEEWQKQIHEHRKTERRSRHSRYSEEEDSQ